MNKKTISVFIVVLLGIILGITIYILFPIKDTKNQENNNTSINSNDTLKEDDNANIISYYKSSGDTHLGLKIENILNEDNYKKIGINPEKYNTFGDFLNELKSYSGINIDLINENFVIGIKKENGNILYIPFDYKKNKDLFDEDKKNKNLAILDIYQAYKNDKLYGGSRAKNKERIIFDYEMKHSKSDELKRIFNSEVNIFDYIKTLEEGNKIGIENEELLGYLYDFIGEYEKSNVLRKKICNEIECNIKEVTFYGNVYDENNKPLKGVKVKILNNPDIYTYTKDDGGYELKYKTIAFSHIRLKSILNGYSDGYATYSLNQYFSPSNKIKVNMNFYMNKYSELITINKNNKKEKEKGKYYIIETEWSKYFIPKDGLYFENGKKYEYKDHDFDIYVYHFTKWSKMDSLLENDTFEPVYGYVGNIMKTFGMPYIQIIDKKTKKEVFTYSSNPVILQNQVYHMKELYENYDKIYGPISKEDMEYLVKYSQEKGGYPIDFDFLTKNNFLRWPARWTLDRKAGTWRNVGHRVLTTDGLVELPFYHIKDN